MNLYECLMTTFIPISVHSECTKDTKRMVFDTIVMKHEENGRPDDGHENALHFRRCCCCCRCSHLNDPPKKSSCHNHSRISRSQNSIASMHCHNSRKNRHVFMRFKIS